MDGIVDKLEYVEHRLEVIEMKSESIFARLIIQVDTVPEGNVVLYLSCAKLRKSAQNAYSFGIFESINQILSYVGFDRFQELYLFLVNYNPNYIQIEVHVSHHLSSSNQLAILWFPTVMCDL